MEASRLGKEHEKGAVVDEKLFGDEREIMVVLRFGVICTDIYLI